MVEIAPGTTVQIVQPGLVVPLGVVKGDKGDTGAPGGSDAAFAGWINDTTPSATRAALSATFGRGAVDPRSYGAVFNGTTDDAAAIQAALDTGQDVIIAPLATTSTLMPVKLGSTIKINTAGQRLFTRNAVLRPSFNGVGVQVNADRAHACVVIDGVSQPGSGDFSAACGIQVGGGVTSSDPYNASVAGSVVAGTIPAPFKGSGIIWQHGPMLDLTSVLISDVTVDGVRATNTFIDNNHGFFNTTHVIRAAGIGYNIQSDALVPDDTKSRHHVFSNAKAFGCGQNFRIESFSNTGTVFSEQGTTPDAFTSTSHGNKIAVLGDAGAFTAWTDAGTGNELSGYNANGAWDTKSQSVRSLRIDNLASGDRVLSQTGADAFADDIQNTNNTVVVTRKNSGTGQRIDVFQSRVEFGANSDRVKVDATYTGLFTVPGSTTLAAGATQYFQLKSGLGYDDQYSVNVTQTGAAAVNVVCGGFYENPGGAAYAQVTNNTASSKDISGMKIRWTLIRLA